MSLSPEVPRGDGAGVVLARFDVDLRQREAVPPGLMDQLRAEAHAAGYAAGWAQGRHAAEAAARVEAEQTAARAREAAARQAALVEQAVAAVAAAAAGLERRAVPTVIELEDTIVATALTLAEAVLRRELALAKDPGADAIARALALAPVDRPVTVRLNPADHAVATAAGGAAREVAGRTVTLVADPGLAPGDALAQSDATTVDARIAPALDRARQALGL